MRSVNVKLIKVLTFVTLLSLETAVFADDKAKPEHANQNGQHADAEAVEDVRPADSKTKSDDKYTQVRGVVKAGEDIELDFGTGKKTKIKGSDLSRDLTKPLADLESAHKAIGNECRSKTAGRELDDLLQNYIAAIAEELDEGTRKSDGGGLIKKEKDLGSKDPSVFQTKRLTAITEGVKQILDLVSKEASDANRAKEQNDRLLSAMEDTNKFFSDGKNGAEVPPLDKIGVDGMKSDKGDSIQTLVDTLEGGDADKFCWFDKRPPNKADGPMPFVAETNPVKSQPEQTGDQPRNPGGNAETQTAGKEGVQKIYEKEYLPGSTPKPRIPYEELLAALEGVGSRFTDDKKQNPDLNPASPTVPLDKDDKTTPPPAGSPPQQASQPPPPGNDKQETPPPTVPPQQDQKQAAMPMPPPSPASAPPAPAAVPENRSSGSTRETAQPQVQLPAQVASFQAMSAPTPPPSASVGSFGSSFSPSTTPLGMPPGMGPNVNYISGQVSNPQAYPTLWR